MGDGYKRAWEDGHLVYPNSPEADFYRESAGGKWCEDFTGSYVINPAFRDRAYGASFGLDWENLGSFFEGFIEGFKGGDIVSQLIGAGGGQTSHATGDLKKEILTVRAKWCADRGIVISGSLAAPVFVATGPGGAQSAAAAQEFETFRAWLVRVFGGGAK